MSREFAHSKQDKAMGEDVVGGEVLKHFPNEIAKKLYPLFVKANARCGNPIMVKGGQLYELFKGKGMRDLVENFRDIMLASDSGKAVQSLVRPVYNRETQTESTQTQWGSGLNHGSTETAHMYIKASIDHAKQLKKSIAILCVDVKTA